MHDVFERMGSYGVVPVLVGVEEVSTVLPICDALSEGGLPVIEITLRTALGEEAIRLVAKERPEMLLGAGTVLTLDQADRAVKAGAHFLVSPGLDPALVRFSQEAGIPITPGAITPSEVQTALGLGVEVAKFFPATTMGGPETVQFLGGPFPTMKFVATGGITPANLTSYLALPNMLACGGTWMFGRGVLHTPDYAGITRRSLETVEMVAQCRGATS